MARTNRRREPNEVVNTKRSIKKSSRRGDRKNFKAKVAGDRLPVGIILMRRFLCKRVQLISER